MSIEKSYDLWAAQYDQNENRTRDLDIRSTQETLSTYNFSSVIELGCGTGKNTSWLLTKADRIIGLDFSEGMLELAKEKINDGRVEFRKADLTKDWNIEHGSADLVTASLTLEHVEDLDHVFFQSARRLKQNGLFFISELHPFKQYQGSKARFETEEGLVELEVFTHHISEYLESGRNNGFELLEFKEWFDEGVEGEVPRLVSFVFRKRG